MNCLVCQKPLRKDNCIGTCRKHRSLSLRRREYEKTWKLRNKDRYLISLKEWRKNNRNQYNKWFREERKIDKSFKIASRIRNAMRRALKENYKSKYFPYEIKEVKKYLETRFKDNMTWKNYGKWEVDHIKPLSFFDLTDSIQFLKACNIKNLQPLWKHENLAKRSLEYGSKSVGLRIKSDDDVR